MPSVRVPRRSCTRASCEPRTAEQIDRSSVVLMASIRVLSLVTHCPRPASTARRRLLTRAGAASGDLLVAAVQVMNTAIATNWHVAAAHTKA